MTELPPAAAALERILWLLPAASREAGVGIGEAARTLGVPPERVLADVEEVTSREYYLPSTEGARLQLSLEGDRLRVWSSGFLTRPPRLTPREVLPLSLALRTRAAAASEGDGAAVRALAGRLEEALATAPPHELLPRYALDADAVPAADRLRRLLVEAAREGRAVDIEYLKPSDASPGSRSVEPLEVVRTRDGWYLLARCRRSDGIRAFRLDRVLSAAVTGEAFARPADFDADDHLAGGRVYRGSAEVEVAVRYTGAAARWVREEMPPGALEEAGEGAVVVRHRVSDPDWIVRRVLSFAPAAEVLEPARIRRRVADAARRMAAT